ncbi:Cytochrome P450 2J2, partial [Halocaridina rubra]
PLILPVIGSAIAMMPSAKVSFAKFQKKYGDICSFKVFGRMTVLISDPLLIRSTGTDNRYSGRPPLFLFNDRNMRISGREDSLGISGTSGDVWRHQRRFALHVMKNLGFGKQSLEPVMRSEFDELHDYFASQGNQKITVGFTFNRSIINVLWGMMIGKRFSHDDNCLKQLVDKINKMLQAFNPFSLAQNLPIIKKLFPNLEVYKRLNGHMMDLLDFLEDQLTTYCKQLDYTGDPNSYVGSYLKELKECKEEGKETLLSMHHLKAGLVDLFLAGSETTASTLQWAIYQLVANPEVQKKMQKELDDIVGPPGMDNHPALSHIESLPYTTAVVYEINRLADLFPFGITHELMDDATLGEYHLPKGTDIIYNLSHAMKSPQYWKCPEKFYPEHFLTSEGKAFKPKAFLPFGYGKRNCLGESLARLELFFFLTNLVHQFSWIIAEDPVIWEDAAVQYRPPDFKVYVSQRM